MKPQLITAKQLAEYASLSLPTVRRLTREGVFPSRRIGKRTVRYPIADVNAVLGINA